MYPQTRVKPPIVTALICAWCVTVFAAINLNSHASVAEFAKFGYLDERALYQGNYWGLVSMAFVHIEPLHLLFNLYWTWTIGSAFERNLGWLTYTAFVISVTFVSSGLQMGTAGLGIGLSGVGYGLFGFGYVTRGRYADFTRICNDQTARMFIFWFFLCVIATYTGAMHIGNVAHLGGLLVGAGVGALMMYPNRTLLIASGLMVLAIGSVVPLFYNPRSSLWVADQAYNAMKRKDYVRAEILLKQFIATGEDPKWGWETLAIVYFNENRPADYAAAMARVKAIDPLDAAQTDDPDAPDDTSPPQKKGK